MWARLVSEALLLKGRGIPPWTHRPFLDRVCVLGGVAQKVMIQAALKHGIDHGPLFARPLAGHVVGSVCTVALGPDRVTKTLREGVKEALEVDLGLLGWLSARADQWLPSHAQGNDYWSALLAEVGRSLHEELDLRREGEKTHRAARCFAELGARAPRVFEASADHLVLERLEGRPLAALDAPLNEDVIADMFTTQLRSAKVLGWMHAAPHPGNLLWDGRSLGWVDFGETFEPREVFWTTLHAVLAAFFRGDKLAALQASAPFSIPWADGTHQSTQIGILETVLERWLPHPVDKVAIDVPLPPEWIGLMRATQTLHFYTRAWQVEVPWPRLLDETWKLSVSIH